MNPSDSDILSFAKDSSRDVGRLDEGYWHVLVVDDDPEVHQITRLALSRTRILDRELRLHNAHSSAQCLEILDEQPDMAVILLDVVMESDNAGLELVRRIRDELQRDEVRIVLRTGQPGYAPEENVVREYDINDYKTKNELTHTHLITSLTAAIRSFQQLRRITQSREGLRQIIQAGSSLLEKRSVQDFSAGVITQITSLLELDADGLICTVLNPESGSAEEPVEPQTWILGAAGRYASLIQEPLEKLDDPEVIDLVNRCLSDRDHIFTPKETALFIGSEEQSAAIYLKTGREIDPVHRELIELFINHTSLAYENVTLFNTLRRAAYIDPLTQLPNRNEFIRVLEDKARQGGRELSAALLDINQFSDINDGLGQEVGNELLIAVARRLRLRFGENTVIARVDSDVFGLIAEPELLSSDRVVDCFDTPFHAGDQQLRAAVTFGTAALRDLGRHGMTMLKRCYIALHTAKKDKQHSWASYRPHLEEETHRRLSLIRSLRNDFAEGRLQLWYQPQIQPGTGRVVGVEALLRWPDRDGQWIPPSVFIPAAEYSGLIVRIGAWVMERACSDLARMDEYCSRPLRVAVNISMPQFRSPAFVPGVRESLERSGIEPSRLELEITESVLMDEPEVVIEVLNTLKQYGATVSLDDFGTGYSSLSYLRRLPLDRMKIDRSFIRDISDAYGSAIASTIMRLARDLNLNSIAEGVETREQEARLIAMGCEEMQGFLYSPALPLEKLQVFLKERD